MKPVTQTITLNSAEHFGRHVPPQAFGDILRLVTMTVRQSIRMAFQGRSRASGKPPSWLVAAADIRFVKHTGNDETVLHFEAPRLGDAARSLYEQKEFWPTKPVASDTGFDLLGDVVADLTADNRDSIRYDRNLLTNVSRYERALGDAFQDLAIGSERYSPQHQAVVDAAVWQRAAEYSHDTPTSKQARICGTLDMIRASTQTFALKLPDGQEAQGVLTGGEIEALLGLFKKEVVVLGKAVFRPSGMLLRIDADEISPATPQDRFFARLPQAQPRKFDLARAIQAQQHKQGVSAIFGRWPGDETDEQIAAALNGIGE